MEREEMEPRWLGRAGGREGSTAERWEQEPRKVSKGRVQMALQGLAMN